MMPMMTLSASIDIVSALFTLAFYEGVNCLHLLFAGRHCDIIDLFTIAIFRTINATNV